MTTANDQHPAHSNDEMPAEMRRGIWATTGLHAESTGAHSHEARNMRAT